VDAKDTVNHWCVGVVSDVDEEKNTVKIHFEGWTTRYDEVNLKRTFLFAIVDEENFIETGTLQETYRGLHRIEKECIQRL
jgi:hypothetical protein